MAGITGFDDQQITSLAQQHDDMADQIQQEVNKLGQEVQACQSGSKNAMTDALNNLYEQFKQDMTQAQQGAVPDLMQMAEDMRTALRDQQAANEENQQAIQKLQSLVGGGGNPFSSL